MGKLTVTEGDYVESDWKLNNTTDLIIDFLIDKYFETKR